MTKKVHLKTIPPAQFKSHLVSVVNKIVHQVLLNHQILHRHHPRIRVPKAAAASTHPAVKLSLQLSHLAFHQMNQVNTHQAANRPPMNIKKIPS